MTSNEVTLTRRAKEVAELVALGLTNREIAGRLFLSERTVEWHVEQIMNKLGFSSRSQIAAWVGRSQSGEPARRQRGNLPAQITSFIGREHELAAIFDLMSSNRLVTVVGAGGTGKTRLALRLGEELETDFQHGVWFCDLAPVADPDLVVDAVRQALGFKGSEPVRARLREQSALIVLDNCEHVQGACAALARDLLESGPGVRVLATSRMPLGLIGEAVWRLEPLPPDDAVRLFEVRATAAVPGFQTSEAVGLICRRLDGVPLAIELVAPRLRVQSAEQLADAVLDPAWLPKSPARHGSIEALVAWSYRLMSPGEQALFRRLGVFAGWFDAEDAAAVSDVAGAPVPVLLGSLAEQSMVVQDPARGGKHYRLLEILKAFALDRLKEQGEVEEVRLLHAERMLVLVPRPDLIPQQSPPIRTRVMSTMVDDVRAALSVLLRTNPAKAALLSASMIVGWSMSGRQKEALRWSELTIAANPEPSVERCWNLFAHAQVLGELGRSDEAARILHEAEAFADSPRNDELRRQTLIARAICYDVIGEFEMAVAVRAAAIEDLKRRGDTRQLAVAMNHNAMSLLFANRAQEAATFAQRSIDLEQDSGSTRVTAALDTLAQAAAMVGDLPKARACWLEALDRGIASWEAGVVPMSLFGLAFVVGLEGNTAEALRLYFLADRLMSELDIPYLEPIAPKVVDLFERLQSEVGADSVKRLRAESLALSPEGVLAKLNNGSVAAQH